MSLGQNFPAAQFFFFVDILIKATKTDFDMFFNV